MRFLAFAALVALGTAVGAAVPPVPPKYLPPFVSVSTDINVQEATALVVTVAVNTAVNKLLFNQSTRTGYLADTGNFSAAGWFGTLIRADLGMTYIFWTSENQVECRAYTGTQPINVPDFAGLPWAHDFPSFASTNRWNPNAERPIAHEFVVPLNRYPVAKAFDSKTGNVILSSNNFLDGITSIVTDMHQGPGAAAWVPESLFDVPAGCNASGSSRSGAAEGILHATGTLPLPRYVDLVRPSPDAAEERHHHHLRAAEDLYHSMPKHMRFEPTPAQLAAVPSSADHRAYVTSVRNQGRCGACWAFSSVAAIEVAYYRNVLKQRVDRWAPSSSQQFSVQHIIDCVHGNLNNTVPVEAKACNGGWQITAFDHVIQHGIVFEKDYVYQGSNLGACLAPATATRAFPIKAAQVIAPYRPDLMMAAIEAGGAITAVIGVPLSLLSFPGGGAAFGDGPMVYNDTQCVETWAHGVTIVGYGEVAANAANHNVSQPYWIVKNSFGPAWADAGYIYMARGVNMCGIETLPTAITPNDAS